MGILSWFRRRRLDLDEADFKDEIRAHLEIAEQERIADGADRETAHFASLKEFGNVTLTTEAAKRVWTPRWLEGVRDLASDVRYAVRALAKNLGFSITVVGVLALGIGLNSAVFTMLKSIVLSPIAGVEGSAGLVVMFAQSSTGRDVRVSYPDYRALREQHGAFAEVFGSSLMSPHLGRGRSARQVSAELVTGNYFQALGVGAQLGRTILPSDETAPGRHPVAVISDALWRREFGADPGIVGRTLEIANYPLTVVGVADPTFHGTIFSYDVEVFVPITMAPALGITGGLAGPPSAAFFTDPRAEVLYPHAWLRAGTSRGDAAAQVNSLWSALSRDRALSDAALQLKVVPFWQSPTGGQTYMFPTVVVLIVMGLLVLMLACANLAGLVLVRGVSRRGEIAVRLALGGTRPRIVRLLVLENIVLAMPGAVLGAVLAWRAIPVLMGYADWLAAPQRLFFNAEVDALVIGFAAVVACVCALVFGLVPAWQCSRVDLVSVINSDASPKGAGRGRLRTGLVVAQVGVSLLLLVGAGLATRSVDAARQADPGFDPDHVAMLAIDVDQGGYNDARGRVFYRSLLDAARAEPGVESATLAAYNPLGMVDHRARPVSVEGYEPGKDEDQAFMVNIAGPDYFRTLRIDLLAGRGFEDRDDETSVPVIVVNNTFAERFWGGAPQALGKRVRVAEGEWRTVIGVATDVKYSRINESPRPYAYVPHFQTYRASMFLYTRGPAPADVLVEQARGLVEELDPDLAVSLARPLVERTRSAFVFLDLMAMMLFVFGMAGMALAAMGTYGLVAYTVKQGTREIGIRMALGATGSSVVRGFLARGLRLAGMGAALGAVAALGAGRFLNSVLYGVSATDPLAFARAFGIVIAVVIVATFVPAWRASRTDPLRALRHQ